MADPTKCRSENRTIYLGQLPAWYYFMRPSNSAFHDLRSDKTQPLPPFIKSLLGLSLKFCPTPRLTSSLSIINTTLVRHQRDLLLKHYFKSHPPPTNDTYNPRLYVRSKWTPPDYAIQPEMKRRFETFRLGYKQLMRVHKGQSNLLLQHQRGLQYLQASTDLIVVPCDKNLGPACIDIPTYINLAYRDHLNDPNTYRLLNEAEASNTTQPIKTLLKKWLDKWKRQLDKHEVCNNRPNIRRHLHHVPSDEGT